MGTPRLSRSGLAYIWSIILIGLCVVGVCLYAAVSGHIGPQWLLLVALTAMSSSASVGLIFVQASISISDTFVFASMLLFGPAAGALTAAIDGLTSSCWMPSARRQPHRVLFNICVPTVSVWCSGHLFFAIAGLPTSGVGAVSISRLILPLLIAALSHFALNTVLIAGALALEMGQPFAEVWKRNFAWLSMPFLASASLALLLLSYTRRVTVGDVALLLPVLALVYFAFRTVSGRMGDTNRHLGQLNRLYLSTIEALAMAIDAKDQVTHGHIRRVQLRAVALARRVGVQEESEIKAIEAAALLHDTGKIAIPEHILNKPGKLTPAEFETMKTHARIGADILSSIEFPFPVVPIVRHHHESWNGSGYPDGIRGVQIPIGARILAVVDCFDALTSHRPYRRAMSDEEAIAILQDRRGSMYDPLVVDTFVSAYKEIVAEGQEPDHGEPVVPAAMPATAAAPSTTSELQTVAVPERAAMSEGVQTLIDLIEREAERLAVEDWGELLLARVARIAPADLSVLFLYDESGDAIEARVARGLHEATLRGLRVPLGERLSGWAAATRRAVVNGDPALDFCETAAESAFRSALSVPLLAGDTLVGVLALYACAPEAFTTADQQAMESLAAPIASATRRCAQGESIVYRFGPLRASA
ncbi:MAG TPA: HD domain-containing phosphohydrolase [Vicinamibacterales bacterium]|jgi:putative nucleotidyltransferase with HDIG domain